MPDPKGVHHVGIPVRDIEASLAWYKEMLGLEPDFVELAEGPEVAQTVQLEDARLRFAFMPIGGCIVELLEYEQPVGKDYELRNCDVGALHLCFEVDDIETTYERLRAKGVEFSIGPTRQSGPIDGQRCCYFRDPDGVQLELWQR